MVFPDDRVAVVVLANEDTGDAPGRIARRIAPLLLPQEDAGKEERQARRIFERLRQGKIDRALFTDNANSYFSGPALKDFATGLRGLGKLQSLTQTARRERGGMSFRRFEVKFPGRNLQILQRTLPGGKIEQYQVSAAE
jgi:hypothetical protein